MIKKETKHRLRICGVHVGYLCNRILYTYTNTFQIHDLRNHMRHIIHEEWGIWIKSQNDIEELQTLVENKHYENISDWMQEYMRHRLNSNHD